MVGRPYVVPGTVAAGGAAAGRGMVLVGVCRNGRGAGMPGRVNGSVGIVAGGMGKVRVPG